MSEQAVDLRSSLAVLRRRKWVLVSVTLLGAAGGVAYSMVRPAMYTSTSQVLLPPPATSSSGQVSSRSVDTDVRIVLSASVLGPAGRQLSPDWTAKQIRDRVSVNADTDEIISIKARDPRPDIAKRIAHAVAYSYVDYVKQSTSSLTTEQQQSLKTRIQTLQTQIDNTTAEITKTTAQLGSESANSAEGRQDQTAIAELTHNKGELIYELDQVQTQLDAASEPASGESGTVTSVIQDAISAQRPDPEARVVLSGLVGALAAFLLVSAGMLVFGRRDQRLRSRDEIADAIGSTVVASVRSRSPRGVAAWGTLLQSYTPDTVDAWALRQTLRRVIPTDLGSDAGPRTRQAVRVTLLSLSNDPQALALGPQLASFAASLGIRTHLVALQRHDSAAALWAACINLSNGEDVRPGLTVDVHRIDRTDADLVIELVVLDRRKPELVDEPGLNVALLSVASGAATAEDLARCALATDDAGSGIEGIVVVDPDSLDRTTGRLSQQERLQRTPLPERMTGGAVEGRASNVSRLRRRR